MVKALKISVTRGYTSPARANLASVRQDHI